MRKNGRKLKEKKMTGLRRSGYKHSRQFFQRAWRYQERGMMEEIILGFVQKKTAMLQNARTKGELQEISKPPKPVYNGNVFTTGKYDTEEEEILVWSLTCLQAPLNNQAYERYKELFCRLLQEKAKILFPEMNENNQAKVA